MIASVRGRVLDLRLDAVVVEVGGVGLLAYATPATLAGLRIGQEAALATSLVVREDALTLYGFADADEREVFETVQTVSGVGPRLALAMLASFSHLGTRHNAWRAVFHLRKSWLSREILFSLLFGAAWLAVTLAVLFLPRAAILLGSVASILGLGLLYSMAQVYHLRAVPAWNTWHTDAGFLASALLLGSLMMSSILSYEAQATGTGLSSREWAGLGGWSVVLLLLGPLFSADHASHPLAVTLWRAFLGLSLLAVVVVYFMPAMLGWWAPGVAFLLVLVSGIRELFEPVGEIEL